MRTSSLYMPKPAAPHVYLWLIYNNISVILLVTRGGEGSTSAVRRARAPGFSRVSGHGRPRAALRSFALPAARICRRRASGCAGPRYECEVSGLGALFNPAVRIQGITYKTPTLHTQTQNSENNDMSTPARYTKAGDEVRST